MKNMLFSQYFICALEKAKGVIPLPLVLFLFNSITYIYQPYKIARTFPFVSSVIINAYKPFVLAVSYPCKK